MLHIGEVSNIVLNSADPLVVVSAIGGITNKLFAAFEDKENSALHLKETEDVHLRVLTSLLEQGRLDEKRVLQLSASIASDVGLVLDMVRSSGENEYHSEIVGFGEIWAAQILSSVLTFSGGRNSNWVNARDFLFLLPGSEVRIDWTRSRSNLPCVPKDTILVITGFLASDHNGKPTTLKRNGSDHSGAIIANLFDAKQLTIWTDVDGIYTADPRVVPSAVRIERMTYKETAELAYFGAKVIHPQTMAPCVQKNIPIVLRNTFNLECPGTLIGKESSVCRAVTVIPFVSVVNVEGSGLFGFSGIAAKLFGAVAAAHVNIIMITQASSEYSICFAVPGPDGQACVSAIEEVFEQEIADNTLEVSTEKAAIVAAVGDGMHAQKGLLGKLATALGSADINIVALAQGSSERNVTFVVAQSDGVHALQALHEALKHT